MSTEVTETKLYACVWVCVCVLLKCPVPHSGIDVIIMSLYVTIEGDVQKE